MNTSGFRHIASLLAVATFGCSGATGPAIAPIEDQVVAVGDQIEVEVAASSSSGGEIRYSYDSNAPDSERAQLTVRPDGTGLFSWTPNAEEVGTWTFDFGATDSTGQATESVTIDVRSALGAATMPVFRRPLGSGTALKMTSGACVDLELAATDQDSTAVVFAEEEPRIEGAELLQETDFEAIWHWCPTDTQWRAQDRYVLTLSADDSANPKAVKRYQIILRDTDKPQCAGQLPVVTHTAADQSSINPLAISVQVADESGLKAAPLVYYSATPPATPPDLSTMTQLTMELADGDTRTGMWKIELPNPLEGRAEATLYYAVVAEDNDDSGGECDHIVIQPFEMKVSAPGGGEGGRGLCEPCTTDAQCGGAADNCLLVGTSGDAFCFTACDDTPGSCGDGYTCSRDPLTSVDGTSARQCVPLDERCDGGNGCPDDIFEQNDGQSQAQVLAAGTTNALRMCPFGNLAADEDWYKVEVAADAQVTVKIAGDTYPNMELSMLDSTGRLVAASEDWGSDDDVTRCLSPGTYFVRVYSYFSGENDYTINVTSTAMACEDTGGTCTDDAFEDDDTYDTSRVPDFEDFQFNSTGNQICSGDEDRFYIYLFGGESIWGTLTFAQSSSNEDLDFLVYEADGTLLTQCTEDNSTGCNPNNGQSSNSNEVIKFTAPVAGDYNIVVRGWADSENAYDICLALQEGICTPPP